jgi:hypothetical protein
MNIDTTKPVYTNIGESAKWPDTIEVKNIKAQNDRDAKAAKHNSKVHGDANKVKEETKK